MEKSVKKNEEKQRLQFELYKKKKEQMLKERCPIKYVGLKKRIRPLLRCILFIQRKLKGQTIEFIHQEQPRKSSPIVFVVSHIGKYDFEIINEFVHKHFHVIASDFMNMYGNINGLFMQANGVIFVDVDSKSDRENSRKMMLKVLEAGDNMMIFPEGTWNLSENEIIRDIHFGAVDIALEKRAGIIPIGVEQYGKRFVVNVGKIFDPSVIKEKITTIPYCELGTKGKAEQDMKLLIKTTATQELRDRLATLKFEIWEREGITKRESIPYNYWQNFIKDRRKEWPGYSMEEQIRNGCFPPQKREYNLMIKEITQMKIKCENAFLFGNSGQNRG